MTPLETKLTAALRANLALIERAQAALTDYLADKDADPRETITRSLSVLDGPQQREAKMLAARGSGRGRRVASALKARACLDCRRRRSSGAFDLVLRPFS